MDATERPGDGQVAGVDLEGERPEATQTKENHAFDVTDTGDITSSKMQ